MQYNHFWVKEYRQTHKHTIVDQMPIFADHCIPDVSITFTIYPRHTPYPAKGCNYSLRHSALPFAQASNLVVMESSWRKHGESERCGPHCGIHGCFFSWKLSWNPLKKLGQEDEGDKASTDPRDVCFCDFRWTFRGVPNSIVRTCTEYPWIMVARCS